MATLCRAGLAQESATYFLHTIEKGQSLYSIASMYGVSLADIVKLNPGSDERIYQGRTLRIPRVVPAADETPQETFHTIAQGETLYRLSVIYKVSADTICQANPGLSAASFRTGQVIRIPSVPASDTGHSNAPAAALQPENLPAEVKPRCREMHKVKRRETVYSISRKYGISEALLMAANPELQGTDKLKRGSFLCIPHEQTPPRQPSAIDRIPTDGELFSKRNSSVKSVGTSIQAAIVLPFLNVNRSEAERMVEYYEGFLMSVDSLKRTGISIDLYTYNSGNDDATLRNVLAQPELKQMDIIFGPLHPAHIKPLANFADKHDIRLVIPFTSKDNTVYKNPSVYLVNTPQSYLYSEVYDHFVRQFPKANVIFIEATQDTAKKAEFIKGLREELRQQGYPTKSISEDADAAQLKASLSPDLTNVFIPTSGSNLTLIKVLPQLTLMVREVPEASVHLFGYPEWQTYTKDHLEAFFELDTYFYSSFYTNNLLPAARQFTQNYRLWYSKEMDDRYPKFGMLGFDTGYYFLKGLSRYGAQFEQNNNALNLTPIQTGFKFQRVNNWGGFINKKVFFVRFSKQYELIKLDFD